MALLGRLVNRSKDYLLFNPLLEGFWLRRARGKITALLYHQIDTTRTDDFLVRGGSPVVTPEVFLQDLRSLQRWGARFYTFRQILAGEFPSPDEFGVAICFDDCFRNNYTVGREALDACDVKATYFQSTAMIDSAELIWEHRLYWHTRNDVQAAAFKRIAQRVLPCDSRLHAASGRTLVAHLREAVPFDDCAKVLAAADAESAIADEMQLMARELYPTAADLRSAASTGHEIASHGHHHYKRVNISDSIFEAELVRSSAVLAAILGERPTSFSYPFDSHLPSDADVCRRYFLGGATVAKRRIERAEDPMWLPRFTWPGTPRNEFRRRRWLLTGTI
jgi:peptidoglycan/xylan/chitin deacetylase (PgdA/CDA1 family)